MEVRDVQERHSLRSVDEATRTGWCFLCGPVNVTRKGDDGWRCKAANDRFFKGGERRRYQEVKGDTCERCGFVAEHPAQLDVHHKDGDHRNSAPANLVTLCANCHRLVHYNDSDPA